VLDLLPNPNIGRFVKEDGEVVGNAKGERARSAPSDLAQKRAAIYSVKQKSVL
jgi:hypothetical protein